jgi:hypothetical protein
MILRWTILRYTLIIINNPIILLDMDCKKSLEENELLKMSKGQEYQNNSKWTDGLPYERSRRMKHQVQMENEEFSKNMDTSAYSSALHHDENTWDILNQTLSGAGFKVSNKREELGDKLANREMVQQIGFNPFLGQSNYVTDISVRDQFLKPINTTQGNKTI